VFNAYQRKHSADDERDLPWFIGLRRGDAVALAVADTAKADLVSSKLVGLGKLSIPADGGRSASTTPCALWTPPTCLVLWPPTSEVDAESNRANAQSRNQPCCRVEVDVPEVVTGRQIVRGQPQRVVAR
jgi:hypothetical protein